MCSIFLTIAPNIVPEVLQKPSVRNPIAISLGAIAGSLCRYYLGLWLPQILGFGFPYATLLVNLSGSFAMGIVTTLVFRKSLDYCSRGAFVNGDRLSRFLYYFF